MMEINSFRCRYRYRAGIFSLAVLFVVWIFSLPVQASKFVSYATSSSDVFVASFSLSNVPEFQSRQVFINKLTFNASGSVFTIAPVPASSTPFYPWSQRYPIDTPWTEVSSNTTFWAWPSIQMRQIPPDSGMTSLRGRFIISRNDFISNKISVCIFSDLTKLLAGPLEYSFDVSVGATGNTLPHALIITKNRCYLFWETLGNKIQGAYFSDPNTITQFELGVNDAFPTFGVSGASVSDGTNEWVVIAYPKNNTTLGIRSFPADTMIPPNGTPVGLVISPDISMPGNLISANVSIFQNPRSKETQLIYTIVSGEHEGWIASISTSGGITTIAGPINLSLSGLPTLGGFTLEITGCMNFENFLAVNRDLNLTGFSQRNGFEFVRTFSTTNQYPSCFQFTSGGKDYLGLLILAPFNTFTFYYRPLAYPSLGAWNPQTKEIYLEGPPWPGTPVTVEVTFPELATGQCLVSAANAGGGMIPMNGAVGVIASQSLATFTLAFDLDLNQASYSSWVGSSQNHLIRLLDPANQAVPITFLGGTARTISIGLLSDLAFDTTYRFSIASGLVTPSGTQLWGPATLSFTTQSSYSASLASEVISLKTFRDPARTFVIANGSEINATSSLYFLLEALDPAPNTIDLATLSYFLDGYNVATISLIQPTQATTTFLGSFTTSIPWGGTHSLRFQTASSTVANTFSVSYPGLSSVFPEPGSSGVRIDTLIKLTFTENIDPTTITSTSIRLHRSGILVPFAVSSVVGPTVTLRPDDAAINRLRTETTYTIEVGKWVTDLAGNPFVNTPATYSSSFTTQASQTPPISIAEVKLFADAAYSQPLADGSDWYATGTIYIQMIGSDGSDLTLDSTIASITGGIFVTLTETASDSGIYRGSFTYAGWPDRLPLRVQSVVSPAASQTLIITYPNLAPLVPASGSTDVPVDTTIRIKADEDLAAGTVTGTSAILLLAGSPVAAVVSYDSTAHEVIIDPVASFVSEGLYTVQVSGVQDKYKNPQSKPLIFQFQAADITPPTLVSQYPLAGSTEVTIDQLIRLTFSEPILALTVTPTNVRLLRDGMLASFTLSASGSVVTIDPDDAPDGGMRVATIYRIEVGPGVTDLKGNHFFNIPATYATIFSTQDANTPPSDIDSFLLFRDPLRLSGYPANAAIPATAAVFLKITGTDGATQTRDITTATVRLFWNGQVYTIPIVETASNSGGIYYGEFYLASIPIYDFPGPLPPTTNGTLSWIPQIKPTLAATTTIVFPKWLPSSSKLETLNGSALASGAVEVRLDTMIDIAFDSSLEFESISPTSLKFTSSGVSVPYSFTWDEASKTITIVPDDYLLPSTVYRVEAPYAANGLRNPQGNPLFRAFEFTFQTQASMTPPSAITSVNLYKDSSFSMPARLSTDADFFASGTLYIEMSGIDRSPLTVDQTIASISNGLQIPLTETGSATGLFRGSCSFAGLPDRFVLKVQSTITPTASQSLLVTYPRLAPAVPASGAVGAPIFTQVVIQADEALDSSSISNAQVRIIVDGATFPSELSYDQDNHRIIIAPHYQLPYSANVLVEAVGVRDLVGNTQIMPLVYRFTTQATSVPPATITALLVATSSAYTPPLPSNATIAPGNTLYVEITGLDRSPTTIDYTFAELISNLRTDTASITLTETSANSGIFRGWVEAFPEEGASLTIRSITNPSYRLQLQTLKKPTFLAISPSSGSIDIPCDTLFHITTDKPVDQTSVLPGTILLSDLSGEVPAIFSWESPTQLALEGSLATDSPVLLRITGWKDIDGIAFPELNAAFHTRAASFTSLEVFIDSALTIPIASGSAVNSATPLWVRLTGRDLRTRTIESTLVQVKAGLNASNFSLTELGGGQFFGSIITPSDEGLKFAIIPLIAPQLAQTFQTFEGFKVISVSPASGAVGVPADTWPTWVFSHPLTSAWQPTAHSGWFILTKTYSPKGLPVGVPVDASYTISLDRRQVELRPWNLLELLAEYELRVAGTVRDENDRLLGTPFITRFTVQPPPPPPQGVTSLKNYRDASYSKTTDFIAPDGTLFLEVVAKDQSISTIDTTRVRVTSSDGSISGNEITLVETATNSGVFRGALPIELPVGTAITIQSQGQPVFVITVMVASRPTVTLTQPASGTNTLHLDQGISLTFDQFIDPTTLDNGLTVSTLGGQQLAVTRTLATDSRTVFINPIQTWPSGTSLIVKITSSLFTTSGLAPAQTAIGFATRAPSSASVEAYSGLQPKARQPVSLLKEALPGNLEIIATTTNLFLTIPETRQVELRLPDGAKQIIELTEVATLPGTFWGSATLPDIRGATATLTLDFASKPSFSFLIAPRPRVLGIIPASGSRNVSEVPIIEASFTRSIPLDIAKNALELSVQGGSSVLPPSFIRAELVTKGVDAATKLQWKPVDSLPPGATVRARVNNLVDRLGQPLDAIETMFTIIGSSGIVLYEDSAFRRPIVGQLVTVPTIYVEVTASGPWVSSASPLLTMITQLTATSPKRLPLRGAATQTRRFQARIDLEAGRHPPSYLVPMVPGEWAKLECPILTSQKRVFYYKVRSDTPPTNIRSIALFRDEYFQERIDGDLHQARLFIQITADDLNWAFPDTTKVHVTSDADPNGLDIILRESGLHTGLFRGTLTLGNLTSAASNLILLARPGDVITLNSVTDPKVAMRIRYLPETRLEHAIAWPSPARGEIVNFSFFLTFPAEVELSVYDSAGDEVHFALIHGREGQNRYSWRLPRRLANGVYFFELRPSPQTEYQTKQKKIRGKFAVLR